MRFARLTAAALLTTGLFAAAARADDEGDIKGVVKDSEGREVGDAAVRLLHREKGELKEVDSVTSDKDGEFKFDDIRNGTYVVVAVKKAQRDRTTVTLKDGDDVENVKLGLRSGKAFEEEAAAARADRKEARAERRQAAEKRREKRDVELTGTIYGVDGKPARNATVRVYTGDAEEETDKLVKVADTTTDAKGNFVFEKLPATHYVLIATKGDEKVRKPVTLNAKNKSENVKFAMGR